MSYFPLSRFGTADPNGAPATNVQNAAGAGHSIACPGDVTADDLLIVHASWYLHPFNSPTCTDTVGTIYTIIASTVSDATITSIIFAGIAPSTGPNTVTYNNSGNLQWENISFSEFGGVFLSTDGTAVGHGTSDPTTPLSITTTNTDVLLFSAIGSYNNPSFTAGAGYTRNNLTTAQDAQATEYAIMHPIDTYAANFGNNTGGDYAATFVAFNLNRTFVPASEGDLYFQTSISPYLGWVLHEGIWIRF